MAGNKKRKVRTEFRKNREVRVRRSDLTRQYQEHGFQKDESARTERVSGKGSISRKRTITVSGEFPEGAEGHASPDVDEANCLRGTVLSVGGLHNPVQAEDGQIYQCATRRLLKTLSTDQRNVVAAGDRVWFRPADNHEGIIERVDPRQGVLCRTSRNRQHVLVANVDLLLIIGSAAEPTLKPNLIDRLLITGEKAKIRPVICINKIDLIDPDDLQPLIGVYGQAGYDVVLLSVTHGWGVDQLRRLIQGRKAVVVGQSGVGKSSLLNAIEPGLQLRVSAVSDETEKGRHTTTAARLIPLATGGYIVDTPGIRQFQLWDVVPEEVGGYFRDIRPYVSLCRFPDCTHLHEAGCAVKDAVAEGRLDARRYESYCQISAGDLV
jgi:ribosome biogenesis GTPase / thiamine phosphate phosphatase